MLLIAAHFKNTFMKPALVWSYILFIVFIFCSAVSVAHPGGHYHKGDGNILNIWQLKNGEQVKGNFSKGNEDVIVLEQEGGKFISVPLENLCEHDQQLAAFKIKRFE